MSPFAYRNGILHAEARDLREVADAIGTPFYCYSRNAMEAQFRAFENSFGSLPKLICYAMKANSNQAVLRVFAKLGAGMDVVSEGELRRARAAGVPPERITFSGVGKTSSELALGLEEGILCFNVESEAELQSLSALALSKGTEARISIRVNPDIDARTHAKISTGKAENKFGIPIGRARETYARAAALPGIVVTGIDMHIGSQITDLRPFDAAFGTLAELVRLLRADGHLIDHVDLGGGLGIPYHAEDDLAAFGPDRYAAIAKRHMEALHVRVVLEPGRFLVGNAGVLIARVILVKQGEDRTFVVVDAAMNDLIRPTLYEAHHEIVPVVEPSLAVETAVVDVVGPVCETGDYLAKSRPLPPLAAGDLVAVLSAGAYGAAQAGTYNSRLLVPEVLVDGAICVVVRPRTTYDELIGRDHVPSWLA